MAKVQGKLVKTEISLDGGTTFKTLNCEQSSGSEHTRETTTAPPTKCDPDAQPQEIALGSSSWNFPFEALEDDDPSASQLTYADLLTILYGGTLVKVRRQYDNTGSTFYMMGSAYLTQLSDTAPAQDFITYSGTFTGTGALDITV